MNLLRLMKLIFPWLFSFFSAAKHPHNPVTLPKFKEPKPTGAYLPKQGHQWNPLLKYPRNESCYCNSGLKYKKCCLLTEPLAVNESFANKAAPLVKTIRKEK